ncbi:MAG: type II toxin-antitoxin system HicB family antitoxin [Phycisphaerae bacterium]|nr:type II toxin-antitoxin system HicB family antitoxin [Phycisphaerae bacterium]
MTKKPTFSETVADGEFAPNTWRRAGEMAGLYSVVLSHADGEWMAKCVELPTVFVFGKTPEAAMKKIQEPLTVVIATLLEAERPVPAPMTEGKRDAQVNVKLTAEERFVVENAAKNRGFKGLSDFFRFAALQIARA